ncbi:uncharacterized protein [Nicotiana sylvestris]|uniref:uncharacterized protein n=1 Tax=Nicotiana sylvestris TaxID=4096 RepID=UPI00388CE035
MTELVGSHTASIQKFEMQIRDLSREQNPKQNGTLPSDIIANPKGSGSGPTSHIMAIITRSGKVLQGESKQVVEVKESEQEVEVEEPRVVEAEKVLEELKVQEVNREEVKEKVKETPKALPPIPRPPPPFIQELLGRLMIANSKRLVPSLQQPPFKRKKALKAFIIPCTIGARDFARALSNNGTSISLMPLAIYNKAGLGILRPTSLRSQMADCSIKRPVGIFDDVLVKVGEFHLPADFIIFDCAVEKEIPIILGRPILATRRALMGSERNEIKFRVNDKEVTFQASKGIKLPHEYESISVIDVVDEMEDAVEIKMEEQCLVKALASILVEQLLNVLKEHRKAIGWTIADIRGILVGICEHKIQLENESKPSVEHQQRLNPSMKEVVKKELIKWLDAGVVYPIADSSWVSPV